MEIEIVKWVQQFFASTFSDYMFYFFTKFGEEIFFLLAFVTIWWCFSKSSAIKMLVLYIVSVGVNTVAKHFVDRQRPYLISSEIKNKLPATGTSFPSGHSQGYACNSGFISAITTPKLKNVWSKVLLNVLILLFGIFGVGFSRLYFGQHYITDVLAGLFLGYLLATAFYFINKSFDITKFKFKKYIPMCVISITVIVLSSVNLLDLSLHKKLLICEFCGIILGTLLTYYIDDRYINYNPHSKPLNQIYKLLLGFGVVAPLYWAFGLFLKDNPMLVFVKMFILTLIAICLMPYIFKLIFKDKNQDAKNLSDSLGSNNKLDNNSYEVICKGVNNTKKFAKKVAKNINGGIVILLNGDLGAGKTTFTRLLLKNFGVKDEIQSPTFTILREYSNDNLNFYHFDLYRIADEDEAEGFGFSEYVNDLKENNVVLIEWWQNAKNLLPDNCIKIDILKVDDNTRKFVITKNYEVEKD